jgi:hypothetical protein
MGISALFTIRILKIPKSYTSVSLTIKVLKYIDRYTQEECIQKNPIKNKLYFEKYKKQISDSKQ